jgi:hypothetical protein
MVHACSRGGTFKYFFATAEVEVVGRRLEASYGPIKRSDVMKTIEIEAERLIFRSTYLGNPITVFRKRKCVADDVERFHALVGYSEAEDVGQS